VIESASYSIRWGHRLAGMDSPTIHPLVKGVVEGARRRLARPVQPKQPLKHDAIAEITLSLNSASASLAHIRFLFILLVRYAGVFRISEVLSIRVRDVSIFDDFMKVYLIMRKNDQYRDGHVSVIARSRKPTFPVGITERLLSLLPDSSSSSNPIVRRIVNSRHSKERFHESLGISYSTAYASFKSYTFRLLFLIQVCMVHSQTYETQHFPAVRYPSSCNTRQAEHVSTAADTRRPEKTSPISAQEIWVGTKVGYGCRALLLDP